MLKSTTIMRSFWAALCLAFLLVGNASAQQVILKNTPEAHRAATVKIAALAPQAMVDPGVVRKSYPRIAGSNLLMGVGAVAGGGGPPPTCTPGAAATAVLARLSGLSTPETTAYCNMVNYMVANSAGCSAWSGSSGHLDLLYIWPTNTTTNANINLCSTSFGLTQSGTVTFTADLGYTPNGTNGFFTTGFVAATAFGNYQQSSATIGGYVIASNTTPGSTVILGAGRGDGTAFAYLAPLNTASNENVTLNDAAFNNISGPNNSQGNWLLTRTSPTLATMYHNETSSGTSSATTVALPDLQMFIFALNNGGSPVDFFNLRSGAAFAGGGMGSTEAIATQHAINGFMSDNGGINVY